MSKTAVDYTLLIVESPTLAVRLQNVAPDHVFVFATGGFLWKPQYDKSTGKLGKKACPDQFERRNELRKEAKYAVKIIVATDSDPSGDFIAWTIHNELNSARIHRGHLGSVSQSSIMRLLSDAVTVDFSTLHKRLENRFKIRQLWFDEFPNISMRTAGMLALFRDPVEISEFQTTNGITLRSERPFKTNFSNRQIELQKSSEAGWIHHSLLSTFDVVAQLRQSLNTGSYFEAQELLQKTFEVSIPDTSEGLITYPRTGNRSFFPDTWSNLQKQWTTTYSVNTFLPEPLRKVPPAGEAHDAIRPVNLDLSPDWVETHMSSDIGRTYRLIYNHTIKCIKMPKPVDDTFQYEESDVLFASSSQITGPRINARPFLSVSELGHQLYRLGVLRPSGFGSFVDEMIKTKKIMVDQDDEVTPGPELLPVLKPGLNFSAILTNLRSAADEPTLADETIRSILSS